MKRYGPIAVAGVVAAVCVRLGVWQLDRLGQRRASNAELAARLALAPVDLAATLPDSLRFRRAVARGTFDFEYQIVEVARALKGQPGVYLVTPLRMPDGRAVLVERGWSYAPDARRADLVALTEPAPASVEGVIVRHEPRGARLTAARPAPDTVWPRYVRAVDPARLSRDYPYPVLPVVLRRLTPPPQMPAALHAIPRPALDDGPHLSYAIQWFAFAVIAVVGSVALVRKRAMEGDGGR